MLNTESTFISAGTHHVPQNLQHGQTKLAVSFLYSGQEGGYRKGSDMTELAKKSLAENKADILFLPTLHSVTNQPN
jgi:hypothetical protein